MKIKEITVGMLLPKNEAVAAIFSEAMPAEWTLIPSNGNADTPAFFASLPQLDYLVVYDNKVERRHIEAASRLRMIQKVGVGFDDVDVAACRERGIDLAICPAGTSDAVAEHTIALVFAALRRIVDLDRGVRQEHGWPRWQFRDRIRQLAGSTVGVVGYGSIGQGVVRRLRALGANVLVHSRSASPASSDEAIDGFTGTLRYSADIEQVFEQASLVTLHVPLTAQTRGMVSEQLLDRLGPEGILVNVSRGAVVDEQALFRALAEGRLGFAALDVLQVEPPAPSTQILTLPNLIVTPHVGGGGFDVIRTKAAFVARNIQNHHTGGPVQALVVPTHSTPV